MAHISAVVLAAGKSERMGRPKALLSYRGHTFLEHILATIKDSPVTDTVVVLGRHRDEIQNRLQLTNTIFNPDYELGMITSLQTGIRALPISCDGALLFLVDHPLVSGAAVAALIDRFAAGQIVLPTFQRRRGHPVLFARTVLDEILQLSVSSGANVVVRKDPSRIIEVPVDDPGVTVDIDTPEEFSKLLELDR